MIIQKINSSSTIGDCKLNQKTAFSMPRLMLTNKNVDTKDFLYHYPIAQKPELAFGNSALKAKNFEDSISKYFKLPDGCNPDDYQIQSAKVIFNGDDVVTIAPTGTGKTVIGQYAISKNLAEGKDSFYTVPIKALANEKYADFCKLYGEKNVGLLTGDIKVNSNAPIRVMTTEIYRNMLLGDNKDGLKNLGTIIYDEFHTINDAERGEVYETAVMYTPKKVQQVMLSGTIENGQELTTWLNRIQAPKNESDMIGSSKKAVLVKMTSKERHVPLKYFIYNKESNTTVPLMLEKYNLSQITKSVKENSLTDKQKEVLQSISTLSKGDKSVENGAKILSEIISKPSGTLENLEKDFCEKLGVDKMEAKRMAAFLSDPDERRFNFEQLSKFSETKRTKIGQSFQELNKLVDMESLGATSAPKEKGSFIPDLVKLLKDDAKVPAIVFKLSKNDCNVYQQKIADSSLGLLNDEEKAAATKIIQRFKDEGRFLGTDVDEKSLLSGAATHHAGKMPWYKKLVETLAQEKLVKVIFATGTLGVGINVPARTVVLSQLDRITGVDEKGKPTYTNLTVNEIQQMLGRAGRRGKDTIGNVIIMPDERHSPESIYKLVTSVPDKIQSRLRPTYSFVSHFMAAEGSGEGFDKVVDRSFLKEELIAREANPEKKLTKMKQRFQSFANVLQLPELGCFEKTEIGLIPTLKGSVAGKARGVDGLLFAETLFKTPLETLKPEQLAAVACYLSEGGCKNKTLKVKEAGNLLKTEFKADTKGKKEKALPVKLDSETTSAIENIEGIQSQIKTIEIKQNVYNKEIIPNLYASQFIKKWAEQPQEKSIENWQKVVTESVSKEFDEGDLYKSINGTVDILKQIEEVSNFVTDNTKDSILRNKMKMLSENAGKALEMLKKSPIADTLAIKVRL